MDKGKQLNTNFIPLHLIEFSLKKKQGAGQNPTLN